MSKNLWILFVVCVCFILFPFLLLLTVHCWSPGLGHEATCGAQRLDGAYATDDDERTKSDGDAHRLADGANLVETKMLMFLRFSLKLCFGCVWIFFWMCFVKYL